jgi:hypothetical protein|tara:strand:- start:96 stop:458 length:363 start_codon:yes stop_codon:yes gene_type:complete
VFCTDDRGVVATELPPPMLIAVPYPLLEPSKAPLPTPLLSARCRLFLSPAALDVNAGAPPPPRPPPPPVVPALDALALPWLFLRDTLAYMLACHGAWPLLCALGCCPYTFPFAPARCRAL